MAPIPVTLRLPTGKSAPDNYVTGEITLEILNGCTVHADHLTITLIHVMFTSEKEGQEDKETNWSMAEAIAYSPLAFYMELQTSDGVALPPVKCPGHNWTNLRDSVQREVEFIRHLTPAGGVPGPVCGVGIVSREAAGNVLQFGFSLIRHS